MAVPILDALDLGLENTSLSGYDVAWIAKGGAPFSVGTAVMSYAIGQRHPDS